MHDVRGFVQQINVGLIKNSRPPTTKTGLEVGRLFLSLSETVGGYVQSASERRRVRMLSSVAIATGFPRTYSG